MTTYKPLEDSLARLERSAKAGDILAFQAETLVFYRTLPRLESYRTWMGTPTPELARHYQSRYEQVKLLLPQSSPNTNTQHGRDVGQLMEGSD
jgi:hypothetical protein